MRGMAVGVILFAWLVLAIVGPVATAIWLRRLWKRRTELSAWTKTLAGLLAAAVLFGALGTAIGFVKGFGAVGGESVDPSQKARILAEWISEAMNCAALGLLVGLPSAVALIVLMRKRRVRAR
jgi:biopolymer transport protein ExbB/TolQ